MPTHDIIDNRKEKLVDHIHRILGPTELARFAVGYFFVSGLESIAERLARVKELRLLIGNTTNRETLDQLAEGYRRMDLVTNALEEQAYPKRPEIRRMVEETSGHVRAGLELMDATDEGESLVRSLVNMIEEKRLKVRVYTRGRLHAKAYIFDYKRGDRYEDGIAIVGSSNLSLAGVTQNTELNVVVQGNDNHAELVKWFDVLWDESQDFDAALMEEMKHSWAVMPARPYDIFMKTLYALVKDRLEGEGDQEILWDDEITNRLADFQKVAVRQAIQIIRDYGGAFVADVVGLGKSYVGAAIVKHFERTEHARPLVLCPAPLVEMWERYNEVYQLNARVLSLGFLKEDENGGAGFLLEEVKFRDRDFTLIDESHNLRHMDTQRYKVVQAFLHVPGRRCCLLTATPRNKSAWDVYAQIKLFHAEEKTDLPVDPPNLRQFFKHIEKGERRLQDLLYHLQIRRIRKHVLRWYGYDAQSQRPLGEMQEQAIRPYLEGTKRAYVLVGGRHQYFPKRDLETIEYSIEETYQGLYQELRGYLGKPRKGLPSKAPENELTYARYGLWHYVIKEKQRLEPYSSLHRAGANLRGLIRILLFKRFESSVFAFRETVRRLITIHQAFLDSLDAGFVPAGEEAQGILYDPSAAEEQDLLEALRQVAGKYQIGDFDGERLAAHLQHDIDLLRRILKLVEPITPQRDAKLQTLLRRLKDKPLDEGKVLLFTQFADTARYLFSALNPGSRKADIDVIFSGDKSKAKIVGRFAPKANPEYRFQSGEREIRTLVATDVLAEGLNLQDCDKVINYDLHWNPVKLIQRLGRIDRIGSEHDVVYAFNFLPETGLERNLGLKEKLHRRIQEIHDTIGEDAIILDRTERLNEEAMYAIYEKKGGQLSLFEEDDEDVVDLNEAEELLRRLRKEDPKEFERIKNLRDGIRATRASLQRGLYVFCEAGHPDRPESRAYQSLYWLDESGHPISRDVPRILGTLQSTPDEPGKPLPKEHNRAVMKVKQGFAEEVVHRHAESRHTLTLTQSQRYVLRELRVLFALADEEDQKAQINILEQAFRGAITTAVNQELNRLRRNAVTAKVLLKALAEIYYRHGMKAWAERQSRRFGEKPVPRVICSESFE